MDEYNHFGDVADAAGVIAGGEALQETKTATTVHVTGGAKGGDVVLTDGPFAETKEVLGGFYLLDCKDLDEAIELGPADPRRLARTRRSPALSSTSPKKADAVPRRGRPDRGWPGSGHPDPAHRRHRRSRGRPPGRGRSWPPRCGSATASPTSPGPG